MLHYSKNIIMEEVESQDQVVIVETQHYQQVVNQEIPLPKQVIEQSQQAVKEQAIEDIRARIITFIDELLANNPQLPKVSMKEKKLKTGTLTQTLQQFDNFKVETASRKVLLELLEYFNKRDHENNQVIRNVNLISDECRVRLDELDRMQTRMELQGHDYSKVMKRLLKIEQRSERAIEGKQGMEAIVNNKLVEVEALMENKLLVLGHYDNRMGYLDQEIGDTRRQMHLHRDELKVDSYKAKEVISRLEDRISHEAEKNSGWINQHHSTIIKQGKRIGDLESQIQILKQQLTMEVDKIESELDRRVIVEHNRREMRAYHDLVQAKFREIDDLNIKVTEQESYIKLILPEKIQKHINYDKKNQEVFKKSSYTNSSNNQSKVEDALQQQKNLRQKQMTQTVRIVSESKNIQATQEILNKSIQLSSNLNNIMQPAEYSLSQLQSDSLQVPIQEEEIKTNSPLIELNHTKRSSQSSERYAPSLKPLSKQSAVRPISQHDSNRPGYEHQIQYSIEKKDQLPPFDITKLTDLQRQLLARDLKDELCILIEPILDLRLQEYLTHHQKEFRRLETALEHQKQVDLERYKEQIDGVITRFEGMFRVQKEKWADEMQYMHKQRARDRSDLELLISKVIVKLKKYKQRITSLKDQNEAMQTLIPLIVEDMHIQIAEAEQEMKDRSLITLLGSKDSKVTKQDMHSHDPLEEPSTNLSSISKSNHQSVPVKIDQRCLSCQVNGHDTQLVLQLFKMACLNYTPNKVNYRGYYFTRGEFLTLRKTLRDKLYQQATAAKIFSASQPQTQLNKLFSELLRNQPSQLLLNNDSSDLLISHRVSVIHNNTNAPGGGTQDESISTENNELLLKPKIHTQIKRVEEINTALNHKKTRTIVFSPQLQTSRNNVNSSQFIASFESIKAKQRLDFDSNRYQTQEFNHKRIKNQSFQMAPATLEMYMPATLHQKNNNLVIGMSQRNVSNELPKIMKQ